MKIVIIGGVAAGAKAAAKIKRDLPNSEVVIYTEDTHVSYSACGLPYYIEGNFEDWHKLIVRTKEEFEKSGISIFTLHRAIKILPEEKLVSIQNLQTLETSLVYYDKLVIATGASPNTLPVNGIDLKNIFYLKRLEDGINIRKTMQKVENVTIIGGGYICIELLEAFVKNNKKVTIIEKMPYLLPIFDNEITQIIQQYILENCKNNVRIITNDTVEEFIGEKQVKTIKTAKGITFDTEMAVISIGVHPNVQIARDAGIEIGVTGAIKVNSRMQTNITDIYACGDCAEKINIITETPMWIPLGSTANKEGRIAAINITGDVEDFEGILGSVVTRYMDLSISMSGLSERVAKTLGYDTVSTIVTKRDKAGYMPEVENITLKLIADRRSHKILGIQAIGCGDADKKVNMISVGLSHRITVENLLNVDLTYAPPFSTSIDIIHFAARMLKNKLNEQV